MAGLIGTSWGKAPAVVLRRAGHFVPAQARSFIGFPFAVPPNAAGLRVRFSFAPARSHRYRNLLTLSLFDPCRFRGAGHRHAPEQEIEVGLTRATPGFVAGPLPAGEWLLEIACHAVLDSPIGGVEYELSVAILADPPPLDEARRHTPARRLDPAPAAPGAPVAGASDPPADAPPGWLKGDLHLHSNHSDGRWTVDELARYVEQMQLDFVALTDHNTVTGIEALERALRAAGSRAVLIPGMELTTFHGHANALGVGEWIDWRVAGPRDRAAAIGDGKRAPPAGAMAHAAAEVRRRGGTFVVNHPRSSGYPACTGCRWEFGDASAAYADAIEVWNGAWGGDSRNSQALALWDRWLNTGRRLPATAGTDAHRFPDRPGRLGFTYVHAQREPAAILAAVRAGRSYLSRGPRLAWRPDAGDGGQTRVSHEPSVLVDGLAAQADVQLVYNGRAVMRQPVAEDGHVILDWLPAAGAAGWYRAELYRRGTDDLLAITNPVYAR